MSGSVGFRRALAALVATAAITGPSAWAKAPPAALVPPVVTASATWVHQAGGPLSDAATQVAVDDAGSAYLLGAAGGHLPQAPAAESGSVFVAKYAPDGTEEWAHQFGTPGVDFGCSIVADHAGGVAIVGFARMALSNDDEAWLARYDSAGNLASRTPINVPPSGCGGAALDRQGNLYYPGSVVVDIPQAVGPDVLRHAMLLVRVAPDGSVVWTRQLSGTASVNGVAVAVDRAGRVDVAGYAQGVVDGAQDQLVGGQLGYGFVASYDRKGVRHWVHEFGNVDTGSSTVAYGVTVDSAGNVAVAGDTSSTLVGSPDFNSGESNAFVVDYTSGGAVRWIRQLGAVHGPPGSASGKYGFAVAADGDGDVVLAGLTVEPTVGHPSPWNDEAFAAELDPQGSLVGYSRIGSPDVDSFGTPTQETANAVAVDRFGNAVVAGWAWGTLTASLEANAGQRDAFVVRYQAESTAAIGDAKARAQSGVVQFVVKLDQPSRTPISVDYETHDGTAEAGVDYVHTFGTLVIPAGATQASIPVTIGAAPSRTGRLQFTMALTNPSAVALTRAAAVGTIILPKH